MKMSRCVTVALLSALATLAGTACQRSAPGRGSNDPFTPIAANEGLIAVNFAEFAVVPDANGQTPLMMLLLDEPGTGRLFVNTMQGGLYSISYDGQAVTPYLAIDAPRWSTSLPQGNELGFQSFAFHPQFAQPGAPGYGRFYTYTDTSNTRAKADFVPDGGGHAHDTVLLEWTARDAWAATYDGAGPREIFRAQQPYSNHNGGHAAFNPLARSGDEDFGLLYVGVADGGSGGDPLGLAQNLSSAFGKILRIDPLGKNSANGKYGIPATNPFANDGRNDTLDEIYAYGVRNPQRLGWDPKTGDLFVADIGQDVVEEVSPVTPGANLGWNKWEGSFSYRQREIDTSNARADASMTYPVVEFDHHDPLLGGPAVTGVIVYRGTAVPALSNKLIFGDNPSGEIFYVDVDNLPNGGQDQIRRILFNDKGSRKRLLQLIQEKNQAHGRDKATRADLRFGVGPQGQILILNKRDGVIREIVP